MHSYYHAALMPGWFPIVAEQMALAHHAGLHHLNVSVLGSEYDILQASELADWSGVEWIIVHKSADFREYERPAISALWQHAIRAPQEQFLYWHTKGVSRPEDRHRKVWRRIMQRYTMADWRANLALLETHDTVGANWCQKMKVAPFYMGNFWLSRGDYLASLPNPEEYARLPIKGLSGPWSRLSAERWLGARDGRRVSHVCSGKMWGRLGRLDKMRRISIDIPGFDYAPYGN